MPRFLVTGGAGFIGSHLVDHLLDKPSTQVVILDNLSYGSDLHNLPQDLKIVGGLSGTRGGSLPKADCLLVVGDVADQKLVETLVAQTDACFHLAAESHVDRSYGDVRPFVDSNVVGSYSVLEAFRNHPRKRLVFMSTDEVYGDKREGLSLETDALTPQNIYSSLKAGGDILARTYALIFSLDVVLARPANNYGPRQFEEKLLPRIITSLLKREKIPVYGDGSSIRDWLFVEDTVRGLYLLYQKGQPGEAYNLGAHQWRTVLEVVRAISQVMNFNWEEHVEYLPDRIRGDKRYALNMEKTQSSLGWEAKVDFQTGIQRTVDWYYEFYTARGSRR